MIFKGDKPADLPVPQATTENPQRVGHGSQHHAACARPIAADSFA
jgi:hypothetical protein